MTRVTGTKDLRVALRALSTPVRLAQLACACACLVALLAPSVQPLRAQSGRKKTPSSRTPVPASARPRTVTTATPTVTPSESPSAPEVKSESKAETENREDAVAPVQNPVAASSTPTPEASAPTRQSGTAPATRTGDSAEVDDGDVVRISSNLVPVPATVVDARGRAVADLQLKDFELTVNGEVKPIGEVSRAETPVSMAVLFDNSSSLRAGREFEVEAAKRFFKSVVRPVDRVAVYSVSTVPTLVRPLTSDVRTLVRAVETFPKPEGATALFDAVAEAAEYLRLERARKVIIIISDGADTISNLDFDTTLARALTNDCQIYAIQTGHSENTNLRDLAAERRLEEFASQTGGAVYVPRNGNDLAGAFEQIAADLSQQYVLSYYPSDERRDGRFRTFAVRVVTRPNLRVRTRRGYYAPKG